jgi:hypothetical protein
MKKIIVVGLCGLFGFLTTITKGATITAVASGNWYTNSTWSCNCQPSNADNVIIPFGRTVSITAGPVILTGGPVITITINGILSLNAGGTLIVDSSDIVKVNSGGKITGAGILDAVWSGGVPIWVPNGTSINGPSTITSGSLPITLLFFKGEVREKSVRLEWASASEKNLDFYSIDRSADGTHFITIASVKGAGSSSLRHDYSFEDSDPLPGVSYYRLQSVDRDGTEESFDIVRVEFEAGPHSVEIYPNPAIGGELYAKLNFAPGEGGQLEVYDSRGGIVAQRPFASEEAEKALELPSTLGKGIYLVIVRTGKEALRTRLAVY